MKIMIEVSGGLVSGITATGEIDIYLIDHDNLECEPDDYIYAKESSTPDSIIEVEEDFFAQLDEVLAEYKKEAKPPAGKGENLAKNKERAERARKALEYYKRELLKEAGKLAYEDEQDLITDIFHFLRFEHNKEKTNQPLNDAIYNMIQSAQNNFSAELAGMDDE